MTAASFIHGVPRGITTLSEIERLHDEVAPTCFTAAFAYATQSGFAAFNFVMGPNFWAQTPSRWLFGLDYGRTQPQAIRSILRKQTASIKIVDGAWIIDKNGFLPRRDFHAKLCILSNPDDSRFGMVVGSGNFSSNGLRTSVEAGTTLYAEALEDFDRTMGSSVRRVDALWDEATPVEEIIDTYEERWLDSFQDEATKARMGRTMSYRKLAGRFGSRPVTLRKTVARISLAIRSIFHAACRGISASTRYQTCR